MASQLCFRIRLYPSVSSSNLEHVGESKLASGRPRCSDLAAAERNVVFKCRELYRDKLSKARPDKRPRGGVKITMLYHTITAILSRTSEMTR